MSRDRRRRLKKITETDGDNRRREEKIAEINGDNRRREEKIAEINGDNRRMTEKMTLVLDGVRAELGLCTILSAELAFVACLLYGAL
jgi:hypothetical protein